MNSSPIKFYSTNEKFGEFSNFAQYPIKMGNKVWKTTEHYFQAQKFPNKAYALKIQKAKSPMEAARLGRSRKEKIRLNWEHIKIPIMKSAVEAKFHQHENLKNLLLSTGERKIIEHTTNDSFWGDGGDGSGKNMLGLILMEIRSQLKKQQN